MTRMVCRSVNFNGDAPHAASLPSGAVLDLTLREGGTAEDFLNNNTFKGVGLDCNPKCSETIFRLKDEFGERFIEYLV